jgi:hypothetical protein
MSNDNIQKMVDILVEDEMNMVRSMGLDEMDSYVYSLIRDKFESMPEVDIIEEYQRVGD